MKLARRLVFASLFVAACAGSEGGDARRHIGTAAEAAKYCAGANVVEGVDISSYQPNVDWGALKGSGREFAFIKITEGTGYTSSTFASQWAGAKSVGMLRGAYHFHRVDADPIAQADHFVGSLPPLEAGDMVMLDVEDSAHGGDAASITANVKACIDHIAQATGRPVVLYTGMWYWQGHMGSPGGFNQYPMFIAAYPNAWASAQDHSYCPNIPDDFAKWTFWQYSSGPDTANGTQLDAPDVPGIGSSCDRDFFNGTLAELAAFAGGAVAGPDWAAGYVAQSWPVASAPPIQLTVGQTATGSIDFKNTGTKTWPAGVVRLAPIPRDAASSFASASWISPTRVSANAADVKPGETAHFEWDLTASQPGDFQPYFGLVAEGLAWFADSGGPPDNDIQVSVHVAQAPPVGAGGGAGSGAAGAAAAGKAGAAGVGVGGAIGKGGAGGKGGATSAGGASTSAGGASPSAGGASPGVGKGGVSGSAGKLGTAGSSVGAGGMATLGKGGGAPGSAPVVVDQEAPKADGGGCGCRVVAPSRTPSALAGLAVLALFVRRRRANRS